MWQKVKMLNAVFLGSKHELKRTPNLKPNQNQLVSSYKTTNKYK